MVRNSRTIRRSVVVITLAALATGYVAAKAAPKPSAADATGPADAAAAARSTTDASPAVAPGDWGQTAVGYLFVRGPGEQPEPGRAPALPTPDELVILQETYARMAVHESVFTEAVSSVSSKIRATAWFKGFEADPDPMAARRRSLAKWLSAAAVPRSRLVRVSMTAASADDARVIAQELGDVLIGRVSLEQKNNERKQIELMTKEQKLLENELDQEVLVQMRAKEQDLGAAGVDPAGAYNEALARYRALQQANDQMMQTIAGVQAEAAELDAAQRDGRTPPDLREVAERDARLVAARTRADDAELRVAEMEATLGKDDPKLAVAKKVQALCQQKADLIREELAVRTFEARRAEVTRRLLTMNANRAVTTEQADKFGKALGQMTTVKAEYAVLRQRERRLRDRMDEFRADIRRIREFHLAVPWGPLKWASEPAPQP